MTHALFLSAGLALALGVGVMGALTLRVLPPGTRRWSALAVLGLPPVILGLTSFHLIPFLWAECAPLTGPDLAVVGGWFGLMVGSLAVSLVASGRRLILAERMLGACPVLDDRRIGGRVEALARALASRVPVVRVLEVERPLAASGGIRRPAVILSRWMLLNLDGPELEAVLAHEVAHLARHSQFVLGLGRLLRDAVFYIPSGWYAFRVLARDEELAADALAVRLTGRPQALAGALGKVWVWALGPPLGRGVSLLGEGDPGRLLEIRLRRLLSDGPPPPTSWAASAVGLPLVSAGLPAVWQVLSLVAEALPMACGLGPI